MIKQSVLCILFNVFLYFSSFKISSVVCDSEYLPSKIPAQECKAWVEGACYPCTASDLESNRISVNAFAISFIKNVSPVPPCPVTSTLCPYSAILNACACFSFNDILTFFPGVCYSIRNGLAVRSEEKAKNVPKIFPTNEIARNKICSVDPLNRHEWRKVGCVVENKLEFRKYIFVVRTYKLDRNEGKSFLKRGQEKVLLKTGALL